jgi:hypothetical protein
LAGQLTDRLKRKAKRLLGSACTAVAFDYIDAFDALKLVGKKEMHGAAATAVCAARRGNFSIDLGGVKSVKASKFS